MALGRISGPLLKSNLLRNGVDLAFETNLLYLDVTNRRVGINTSTPSNDLQVNGTARVTILNVSGTATLGTISFTSNSITSTSNQINISASGANPVVYQGTLQVGNLQMTSNTISATGVNQNIVFNTTGTGAVTVNSNLTVNGNLNTQGNMQVSGNVTVAGTVQIGDQTTDTVAFTAGVNSNILPSTTNTYNLGSASLQWNNVYANNLTLGTFTATNLSTANLTFNNGVITNTVTNQDISFVTNGTGGINIGNFRINSNNILNTVPNAVSNFSQTTSSSTFTATIANSGPITFTASVSGNVLTVSSAPSGGTLAVGQCISGGSIPAGTYIVSNTSGTGTSTSSTWTISNYLTQSASTVTATPTVLTVATSPVPVGTIYKGMLLTGTGISTGTVITAFLTGTGAAGTYYISPNQTVVTPTVISASIQGYVNIGGTNGVVIPAGTTSQRPGSPTQGMIRFNSDPATLAVEIFNGSSWTGVAGIQSGITLAQATDISVQWALTLG
jgi:hypothetical protein